MRIAARPGPRTPETVLFVASIWPTLSGFVRPVAESFAEAGMRTIGAAAGAPAAEGFDVCEQIHDFRRRGPQHVLVAANDLVRLVRRHNVDLMYLHTPVAVAIGRLTSLVTRVPAVSEIYGTFLGVGGFEEWSFRAVERLSARLSFSTIALNDDDAAFYRRLVPPASVSMFPGVGVPEARLRAAADAAIAAGERNDTPVLGVVARLTPDKGPDFLVQAVRAVRARGVGVRLRFIGDVQSGEKAWKPPDEEWIELTGWLSDPLSAIAACDLVVSGSRREGFGQGVAESLVLGKRVVALTNAGTRQQKPIAKDRLVIVPPDVDLFASAVIDQLAAPALGGYQEDLAVAWGREAAVRFHREHLASLYPGLRV